MVGCFFQEYVAELDLKYYWASLVAQIVKNLPATWETQVWSLGQKDPLEKGEATHSIILAWRIPWAEEPGRLQSTWPQKIKCDWAHCVQFCQICLSYFSVLSRTSWTGPLSLFDKSSYDYYLGREQKTRPNLRKLNWSYSQIFFESSLDTVTAKSHHNVFMKEVLCPCGYGSNCYKNWRE